MADFDVRQVREAAARALDANFNPDRYPVLAAMFTDYAQVAMAVIVPAVTAQIRALHRPVHLTFSWKEGVRAEEPCEVCGGRAEGDRECGCWGDVDRDLYCLSCSDLSGHTSHHTDYPCPTVRLLDQIEQAVATC